MLVTEISVGCIWYHVYPFVNLVDLLAPKPQAFHLSRVISGSIGIHHRDGKGVKGR